MALLVEHKDIEFVMSYYVKTGKFEKVTVLNFHTKEEIGEATFSTVAAPKNADDRSGSLTTTSRAAAGASRVTVPTRGVAAAGRGAGRGAATAANRSSKSTVAAGRGVQRPKPAGRGGGG